MHRQIQHGRKSIVNLFKKFSNLLESCFSTYWTSPHWTWSSVTKEKAKTLKILWHDI